MINTLANSRRTGLPVHGWIGGFFVVIFWYLNWTLTGPRTHWGFFGLWLGYCLLVDALVYTRKGHSLLTRNTKAYLAMFLVSVAGWWLFELFNWRTQNWTYIGKELFTNWEYGLLASLSFSTVMPAVIGTAELIGTSTWLQNVKPGPKIKPTNQTLLAFFVTGWVMLGLLMLWPGYFFPFVWLSVFFLLAPINVWLGNRSLTYPVSKGDWRPVIALWLGGLTCGFFWEMWNFYAYPKWIYHVPFVDFARVFEMPLLGYGGYLPFALELFALYHLIVSLAGKKKDWDYVQIISEEI